MSKIILSRRWLSGFSLIELLVVIAIIGILATVTLTNMAEARKQSRDAARATTLKQITQVLTLYQARFGTLPNCNSGFKIEPGFPEISGDPVCPADEKGRLTAIFNEVLGQIPSDPLGAGNSEFFFYFNANHDCADEPGSPTIGAYKAIVFANMEIAANSNKNQVCPAMQNNANNQGFYHYNSIVQRATNVRVESVGCAPNFQTANCL